MKCVTFAGLYFGVENSFPPFAASSGLESTSVFSAAPSLRFAAVIPEAALPAF